MGTVNWVQLAQDRERALVNTMMNFGVHGEFLG
jgi:hypothetical protein